MPNSNTQVNLVERYKKQTIWFHWMHTMAFLVLLITGMFMFVPGWGIVAQDSITRVIHRIAAIVFVVGPILFLPLNPKGALHFVKETFTWGKEDIGWLKAAPIYYFGGPEDIMPPQGHANSGQKMWQLVIFGTGIVFFVTGCIIWFAKGSVSPELFRWSIFVHDIAFILAGNMLLLHIYLGVMHPRMTESLRSMWTGKISDTYARTHYAKWYDEVTEKRHSE
ncbi:MAG: cytochrome b/b6 domain-containing protein [Chloroflexota bacterium]|nr:cytochrome b/b6 domain-containing protein [Chloroflexota bacterium]